MKSCSPTMPFGKYAGRKLCHIRRDYLDWLLGEDWLFDDLREDIESELGHRDWLKAQRVAALTSARDLTTGEAGFVECVPLTPEEAALFADAVRRGELLLTPDVPCKTPVEEAWRRWCAAWGAAHRVREVRWDEVENAMRETP